MVVAYILRLYSGKINQQYKCINIILVDISDVSLYEKYVGCTNAYCAKISAIYDTRNALCEMQQHFYKNIRFHVRLKSYTWL